MRKFLLSIFMLFSAGVVFAQQPKTIQIPIEPKPYPQHPTPIKPRTPVQSDIEAYYSNEALTLIFNKDLGDADAVVSNLTTGDMWSASVSGVCSTTILLSGDEGYYQIVIYSDNEDYAGEFLL